MRIKYKLMRCFSPPQVFRKTGLLCLLLLMDFSKHQQSKVRMKLTPLVSLCCTWELWTAEKLKNHVNVMRLLLRKAMSNSRGRHWKLFTGQVQSMQRHLPTALAGWDRARIVKTWPHSLTTSWRGRELQMRGVVGNMVLQNYKKAPTSNKFKWKMCSQAYSRPW